MPRSHISSSKKFREFSRLPDRYLGHNGFKNSSLVYRKMRSKYGLARPELDFMLFIYDLEFFTIDYICQAYEQSKKQLPIKVLYPLQRRGYIYKHFDKLTSKKDPADQMFHSETKFNYRVRYALSQKGRLMVQRFYNEL